MSQRYTKFEKGAYILPPDIPEEQKKAFELTLACIFADYNRYLTAGIKPEDARFVLPEATKTRMIITLNLRTLLELTEKRATNSGAQWEIKQLVRDMWTDVNRDLKEIFKPELTWLDDTTE